MTRIEKRKAAENHLKRLQMRDEGLDASCDVYDAFIEGVEWAEEKIVKKAEVWLMSHINDYLVKGRDIDYMFDDFRKAMED